MPWEIEAKFKVDQFEVIRKRLKQAKAQLKERAVQHDKIFRSSEMVELPADSNLRVRSEKIGDQTRTSMCFKGPKAKGPYKKRQEIEFEIGDGDKGAGLLEALGYRQILNVEKKRETWLLGPCLVCLDEVKLLGFFIEIEGPDESAVQVAIKTLGLEGGKSIKKGYPALLAKKLGIR